MLHPRPMQLVRFLCQLQLLYSACSASSASSTTAAPLNLVKVVGKTLVNRYAWHENTTLDWQGRRVNAFVPSGLVMAFPEDKHVSPVFNRWAVFNYQEDVNDWRSKLSNTFSSSDVDQFMEHTAVACQITVNNCIYDNETAQPEIFLFCKACNGSSHNALPADSKADFMQLACPRASTDWLQLPKSGGPPDAGPLASNQLRLIVNNDGIDQMPTHEEDWNFCGVVLNMTYGTGEGKTDFRVRFTLEPSMQVPKGCDGEHCNPRLDVNGSLADRTLTLPLFVHRAELVSENRAAEPVLIQLLERMRAHHLLEDGKLNTLFFRLLTQCHHTSLQLPGNFSRCGAVFMVAEPASRFADVDYNTVVWTVEAKDQAPPDDFCGLGLLLGPFKNSTAVYGSRNTVFVCTCVGSTCDSRFDTDVLPQSRISEITVGNCTTTHALQLIVQKSVCFVTNSTDYDQHPPVKGLWGHCQVQRFQNNGSDRSKLEYSFVEPAKENAIIPLTEHPLDAVCIPREYGVQTSLLCTCFCVAQQDMACNELDDKPGRIPPQFMKDCLVHAEDNELYGLYTDQHTLFTGEYLYTEQLIVPTTAPLAMNLVTEEGMFVVSVDTLTRRLLAQGLFNPADWRYRLGEGALSAFWPLCDLNNWHRAEVVEGFKCWLRTGASANNTPTASEEEAQFGPTGLPVTELSMDCCGDPYILRFFLANQLTANLNTLSLDTQHFAGHPRKARTVDDTDLEKDALWKTYREQLDIHATLINLGLHTLANVTADVPDPSPLRRKYRPPIVPYALLW